MKMKVIHIIYIIFCLFISCKTAVLKDLECNIDFGIDESNLGDIKINCIKKDFKDEFIYYQYVLEECPGYLSNNCLRYYSFYSESIPILGENIKESNNCFLLSENQKYILPIANYNNFIKSLPDSSIKNELVSKLSTDFGNDVFGERSIIIDERKNTKLFKISINSVSVYEFEINTEQLNYYFPPSGAIYTYSAFPTQKTKILILVPTEN